MHSQGKKMLAVIGMFDGYHSGHQSLMDAACTVASAYGFDVTVVTFDSHPLAVIAPDRQPPMLMPNAVRLRRLSDHFPTIAMDFAKIRPLTALEFMTLLRDRYNVGALYMGFNHRFGSDRLSDPTDYDRIAASLGMKIYHGMEHEEQGLKVSSTAIRQALSQGKIEEANSMLGHPYTIYGMVVEGKQLGRKLGFPTANVQLDEPRQLVPLEGVYTAKALLPGTPEAIAVVNIGRRPTVDGTDAPLSIEAHLLDSSGDFYGLPIRLQLLNRLRGEQKFPSLEALSAQLQQDVATARRRAHAGEA